MALPILPILIVGGIVLMAAGRKKRTEDGMDDPFVPCQAGTGPPNAPNYRWGTGGREGGQSCVNCRHITVRTIGQADINWCSKYDGGTGGMCLCDSWEPMPPAGES